MLATVALTGYSIGALAGTPYTGPDAGSVGLSGRVPGPPPTAAAVITSPRNGQRFAASPITVTGTCPKDLIVELYKNDIFAGSGVCHDDQTFKFDIDLLYGANTLVARVYDALDQPGPDSAAVTIYYDALPPQGAPVDSSNSNNIQLLLRSSPVYRGAFPKDTLKIPLEIIGGKAPFAVNVDWGDDKSDLFTRADNSPFEVKHAYVRPGTYQVTFRASDSQQRVAFLTVIVIINGRAEVASGITKLGPRASDRGGLLLVWPILGAAVLMVISFWLGERREKHVLTSRLASPSR